MSFLEKTADYLGLTLETVSRQFSALKRDGLIELEGKRGVIIPDFEALILETGDDADATTPVDGAAHLRGAGVQ